jgi:hypothetical protein
MQKILTDRLRPRGETILGVELAIRLLQTSYGMNDQEMATKT